MENHHDERNSCFCCKRGNHCGWSIYIFVVKENQLNIAFIKEELKEIKNIGEKNNSSIRATNLFVAQAHPDRDASRLSSILKLKRFNNHEILALAYALPEVKIGLGPNNEIVKIPMNIEKLVMKYDLTGKDMANFISVADKPIKSTSHNM